MSNPRAAESDMHGIGRARERADILDFIRHPPGRVPDNLRASLAELAAAIERGDHVGGARRLYETDHGAEREVTP